MPSLLNRENLSFCEHFHNYGAWNKTHETGWFLCQTRTMFVTERGDELWLAPFMPAQWLRPGGRVSVRTAPTRFGQVGYTIDSTPAAGLIRTTVQLPDHCAARKVILRLRVPGAKGLQSVRLGGKAFTDFDAAKGTIALPVVAGTTEVEATY